MSQFEIIFYTKEDGTQPAREFMDGLSLKMRARVAKIVAMLQEYGGQVRMPYSEYLKGWCHHGVVKRHIPVRNSRC